MAEDLVLYSLGEEVVAYARRRVIIVDNALPRMSEFGHCKRRKESRSHKRESGREGNRKKDDTEARKTVVVPFAGYKKDDASRL